jgi:beta-galactosidase GanA
MEIEIIDDKKIIITLENGNDTLNVQNIAEYAEYLQRIAEMEADIDRYDGSDDGYDRDYYNKAYANDYADHECEDEYDVMNNPKLSADVKSLYALIEESLAGFKQKRENYLLRKCS